MRRLAGSAHVWVDAVGDESQAARRLATLSDAEVRRANAYLRAEDRLSYIAAHGLLRSALSWAVPSVPQHAWAYRVQEHGKPELAHHHQADTELRFSLSHSTRHVAVAISSGTDCGIDVESGDRANDIALLAPAVLAPSELHAMRATSPADRRRFFLRLWTLKESYAKARGLGLRLPFDELAFELDSPIRLVDGTTPDGAAKDWHFEQWMHDGDPVAFAAGTEMGINREVVVHDSCPH